MDEAVESVHAPQSERYEFVEDEYDDGPSFENFEFLDEIVFDDFPMQDEATCCCMNCISHVSHVYYNFISSGWHTKKKLHQKSNFQFIKKI